MARSETGAAGSRSAGEVPATQREFPPQDGGLALHVPESPPGPVVLAPGSNGQPHSGLLQRPLDELDRAAVTPDTACTELERYKLAQRRYAPVQRGVDGLPWPGLWYCAACAATVPGQFVYSPGEDEIYLETTCPACGPRRERHHDVLFVKFPLQAAHRRQPRRTFSGAPIRPILGGLPRTVETLCPECSALILGRYYAADGIVWIEKTCPDHGHFRDKVNTDLALFRRSARAGFQDERGVLRPQVRDAQYCPTDCGLCSQHHSTSCLAQIDLTNRCNLTCPVCFASANQAGYVAEPSFELVVEQLRSLRNQQPHPATAIQFTGGEPTVHPDFFRILRAARELGFSHIQIATNGIRIADRAFAEQAAEAGLHTLYLQFDGLDDDDYRKLRGRPLLETKLRVLDNCRATGMKICFVPTIVKTVNDDQVGKIFRFAVENVDVVSAISYQPVSFSGRINHHERMQKRYTLGDLAHDLAAASGAELARDFFPLNFVTPLSRIMQALDGQPKIRPSCHSDCAFGTYFFVTPDRQAVPMPRVFNLPKLMHGLNELAARIERTRIAPAFRGWANDPTQPLPRANWRDWLSLARVFLGSYRWTQRAGGITPLTFMHTLRGMTNKEYGRGTAGRKTFRTLMAAGMHFMDRYNFDTERIKRCVIQYSTPDGIYPFCTINCGPTYRPYLERMIARPLDT